MKRMMRMELALPCLIGPLAPRGAVGARHDGLPRQFSPLLPVVCHVEVEGNRKKGRPKRRWMDNVHFDLGEKGPHNRTVGRQLVIYIDPHTEVGKDAEDVGTFWNKLEMLQ